MRSGGGIVTRSAVRRKDGVGVHLIRFSATAVMPEWCRVWRRGPRFTRIWKLWLNIAVIDVTRPPLIVVQGDAEDSDAGG